MTHSIMIRSNRFILIIISQNYEVFMVARTTAKTGSEELTARIVPVEAFNSTHIEYKAKMTGDSLKEMVQCGKTFCRQ